MLLEPNRELDIVETILTEQVYHELPDCAEIYVSSLYAPDHRSGYLNLVNEIGQLSGLMLIVGLLHPWEQLLGLDCNQFMSRIDDL